MPCHIETLISAENWDGARKAILAQLVNEPKSHWLLTRLSLTYYEQRRYEEALVYSKRALRLAPCCPLVLWDFAGTLAMLGRRPEAIRIYRRLIRRGVESLAFDECGEGVAQARRMIADCWYGIARCFKAAGRRKSARRAIEEHLRLRGLGWGSIYPIEDVHRDLGALQDD